MKLAFVIDENIVLNAHRGVDSKGKGTLMAVALIAEIEANGHLILVSEETLARYHGKLKSLETQRSAPALNMPRVFSLLLFDPTRTRKVDVSSVHLPAGIPSKDEPFAKVAVARTPCVLVTEDEPLLQAIVKTSLQTKGVAPANTREGVTKARTPDC